MKHRFKRVYVWGWFGRTNSGDDILLEMALRLLGETELELQPVLQVPPNGVLPHLASTTVVTRPRRLFKGSLMLSHFWRVLRSDALVFGGGSSMSDADPARVSGLRFFRRCCQVAKLKGIPIVFIALGLGPFRTDKGYQLGREILEMADIVEVRDAESLHIIQSMELSTRVLKGFDPAVLLPPTASRPTGKRTKDAAAPVSVGIALSRSPGTTFNVEERLNWNIQALAKGLQDFNKNTPIRVTAIEMCANSSSGDLKACEQIVESCRSFCDVEILRYSPEPKEMMRRFLQCDAIIAERLHGAILSYALGIPFAVMPYHAKCEAFSREIGLPEHCVLSAKTTHDEVTKVLGALIREPATCCPKVDVEETKVIAKRSRSTFAEALREMLAS